MQKINKNLKQNLECKAIFNFRLTNDKFWIRCAEDYLQAILSLLTVV